VHIITSLQIVRLLPPIVVSEEEGDDDAGVMVGGDGAEDPPLDPAEEEEVDEPLRDKDGDRSSRPRVASLGHLEETEEVTTVSPWMLDALNVSRTLESLWNLLSSHHF
jgi:hypothetical protein